MARKWWWPFGSSEEEQAESQFLEMLQEASVRTDDLMQAVEELKVERLKRVERFRDSRYPPFPREKLQSNAG
jgi:hypothetical protein